MGTTVRIRTRRRAGLATVRIRTNRQAVLKAAEDSATTERVQYDANAFVYDRDGAAWYLGMSTEALDRLILNGYLSAAKIGRAVRVRRSALDEYWDAHLVRGKRRMA